MDTLPVLALVIGAYLLGSLSFAVLVSRAYGLPDPRTFGSRNPGATNMLRSGRRMAAVWTLLGDSLKGAIAVGVARLALRGLPIVEPADDVLGLVALAAFLGHLYPVFFRFEGGKGVATAAGILLLLSWPMGLGTLLVWLAVFGLTRLSSLAAIAAAFAAPVLAFSLLGSSSISFVVLLMALLLIWRHRSNIRKLLAGEEDKTFTRR